MKTLECFHFGVGMTLKALFSKALTAKLKIIYRFNEFVLYNYNIIVVCGVLVLGNNIKNVEDGTDLSP